MCYIIILLWLLLMIFKLFNICLEFGFPASLCLTCSHQSLVASVLSETKCPRLTLYFCCHRAKINYFSKELSFLFKGSIFKKSRPWCPVDLLLLDGPSSSKPNPNYCILPYIFFSHICLSLSLCQPGSNSISWFAHFLYPTVSRHKYRYQL